ncbi:GNAT family N-acetyltransferase [Sulfitobacter sp. PR48]|uniref:GNAT family N-acetyltransferase n=1 Tax=Sulfitobacter sp. PR48 TaxID=3028383 RepID=UPI00235BDD11|nr:GNAT family N-acetyltransferase [Sulfitobacter sp. PR48]MDD9722696.1 GNAT family N-acetyltransferase [Sulfitobacter sp. PR48]GLT09728.1 N-acetyltransferase [Sulfitobacter porphyrae]
MKIRQAEIRDVRQMSDFLTRLRELGKRRNPSDADFVRRHYLEDPDGIRCSVAEDADETVLGFQSLKLARKGNIYDVTPGWGIIGTHIRPEAARRGVGRALFSATLEAAKAAGLQHIDASIAADNPEGLAYYQAMGFETYRTPDGLICKRYSL